MSFGEVGGEKLPRSSQHQQRLHRGGGVERPESKVKNNIQRIVWNALPTKAHSQRVAPPPNLLAPILAPPPAHTHCTAVDLFVHCTRLQVLDASGSVDSQATLRSADSLRNPLRGTPNTLDHSPALRGLCPLRHTRIAFGVSRCCFNAANVASASA